MSLDLLSIYEHATFLISIKKSFLQKPYFYTSRSSQMHQNLVAYIHRYVEMSDTEIEVFNCYLIKRKISKREHLIEAQKETCTARYYIVKGCVRLYYFDEKGNEQIIHFGIDNWWISDYESLVNQLPAKLHLQAIEDTELLELTTEAFEQLSKKLPKVERLFRIIMEKTTVAFHNRIAYMLSSSGEELYTTFINANPGFCQRVPQYMIASYLGMTLEFVSKVRSRTKNNS